MTTCTMTPTKPTFRFAFGPRNYRLMWVGLALLAAGFITMMFGDKENYGEDFVGITLGPLLLLAGFGWSLPPLWCATSRWCRRRP